MYYQQTLMTEEKILPVCHSISIGTALLSFAVPFITYLLLKLTETEFHLDGMAVVLTVMYASPVWVFFGLVSVFWVACGLIRRERGPVRYFAYPVCGVAMIPVALIMLAGIIILITGLAGKFMH